MLPWRPLTLPIAAAAVLSIASCLGGRSGGNDDPATRSGPAGEYAPGQPESVLLPAYLNEDGSLKDGYDIIDMRNNSSPTCQVHRVAMSEELQKGREQFRNGSREWGYEDFVDAQGKMFPNAQRWIRTPWDVGSDVYPWEKLVRYCPECRRVQARWVTDAWRRKKELMDSRP